MNKANAMVATLTLFMCVAGVFLSLWMGRWDTSGEWLTATILAVKNAAECYAKYINE